MKTPAQDLPFIQLADGTRIHLQGLDVLVKRVETFVEAGERDLELLCTITRIEENDV